MIIYFSCSLTGGRDDEHVYAAIVNHLETLQHEVPTAHLSRPEVMELEKVVEPRQVFLRDMAWIEGCDAVVAEVSTPSHGVGYEIACALALEKPVLCLHRAGVPVSKMITGNNAPGLMVRPYHDDAEALSFMETFLIRLGPASNAA